MQTVPSAMLKDSKVVFLVQNPLGRLFQQWSYKVSVPWRRAAGSERTQHSFSAPSAEGDRCRPDASGAGGGEHRESSLHGSVGAAGAGNNQGLLHFLLPGTLLFLTSTFDDKTVLLCLKAHPRVLGIHPLAGAGAETSRTGRPPESGGTPPDVRLTAEHPCGLW